MKIGTVIKVVVGGVIGIGTKQVVKAVVANAVKDIDVDRKTQIFLDIGAAAIGIAMSSVAANAVEKEITRIEQTIENIKLQNMKSAEVVEESTIKEEAE